MDSSELVVEGAWLMVFGMGTVFVFLTLLVFATVLMSKAVLKFTPPEEESAPLSNSAGAAPDQTQLLAVISAAVHRYRAEHENKK